MGKEGRAQNRNNGRAHPPVMRGMVKSTVLTPAAFPQKIEEKRLRPPTRDAGDGEEHGEELGEEAHGAVDQACGRAGRAQRAFHAQTRHAWNRPAEQRSCGAQWRGGPGLRAGRCSALAFHAQHAVEGEVRKFIHALGHQVGRVMHAEGHMKWRDKEGQQGGEEANLA